MYEHDVWMVLLCLVFWSLMFIINLQSFTIVKNVRSVNKLPSFEVFCYICVKCRFENSRATATFKTLILEVFLESGTIKVLVLKISIRSTKKYSQSVWS